MVRKNALAECVYTFIIIHTAICIIPPNKAIDQGCYQGQQPDLLQCPQQQTQKILNTNIGPVLVHFSGSVFVKMQS